MASKGDTGKSAVALILVLGGIFVGTEVLLSLFGPKRELEGCGCEHARR